MPDLYVKVSSAWKRVKRPYVKVSSAWKGVDKAYVKVGGAWKLFYQHLNPNLVGGAGFFTGTLFPTNASCSYRLTAAGVEQADQGSGFANINTWLPVGGNIDDYEVRYSPSGDTGFMSGTAIATWLPANVVRTWTVSDSTAGTIGHIVDGLVEVRPAGGGAVLDSAQVRLEANSEI